MMIKLLSSYFLRAGEVITSGRAAGFKKTDQSGFLSQKHPKVEWEQHLYSSTGRHRPQSSPGSLIPWHGTMTPGQT
jgi:hypothetical protein